MLDILLDSVVGNTVFYLWWIHGYLCIGQSVFAEERCHNGILFFGTLVDFGGVVAQFFIDKRPCDLVGFEFALCQSLPTT